MLMRFLRNVRSLASGAAWAVRAPGLRARLAEAHADLARARELLAGGAGGPDPSALARDLAAAIPLPPVPWPDPPPPPFPRIALAKGHRVWLHRPEVDRFISPDLATRGIYEPAETALFEREVRPGMTVLDVGANIGYFTLLSARLVGPEGRVFAFEPDPDNFRLLNRNITDNGYRNVTAVNAAVTDRDGTLRLHRSAVNSGDHRAYDSADGRPAVEVRAVRLDSLDLGGGADFVKMDIQGSEWAALRGMERLLSAERSPRLRLLMEFWPIGLTRFGVEPAAVLRLLSDAGLRILELDPDTGVPSPTEADPAVLLARHPPQTNSFANLYCVRGV
jgi:FkbM family methyltransferase